MFRSQICIKKYTAISETSETCLTKKTKRSSNWPRESRSLLRLKTHPLHVRGNSTFVIRTNMMIMEAHYSLKKSEKFSVGAPISGLNCMC
jgi:hypothetical protein